MTDDNISNRRGGGRPANSRNFRTVAVVAQEPDLRKLARTLLELAEVVSKPAEEASDEPS